jgi:16S rRNA G966 N2-methylase RsmD
MSDRNLFESRADASTRGTPSKDRIQEAHQRQDADGANAAPSAAEHRDLRIEEQAIASLTLRRNNPRTHSEKQIRQIAASIETFGFTNPVLIDSSSTVIAGHGRVRAAKQLGLETVPTIQLEHLTKEQVSAYVIADNKLAECAGWDRDLLAIELQGLAEIDLDFGLEVTGFETAEIDLLIGEAAEGDEPDPADATAGIDPDLPTLSRKDDLCQMVGLLANQKAQMVFVDPPYNVPIDGHVVGLGRMRHAEFAMASGEMSETEFTDFLAAALGYHALHSAEGALHFVCMDWRHAGELLGASRSIYSEFKNLCVWVKTNAGMGSLHRSQHELVFLFKVGNAPHVNNVALGRHGRSRSNVWRYAGVNSFGAERDETLAMHPTVKPVRLVADAILDCSRRGDRVLDGFAGSGTTLLAAERTGRVGYGLEIEPRYVDAAIRRLAEHAGLGALHVEAGRSFQEMAESQAEETNHGSTSESRNAARREA